MCPFKHKKCLVYERELQRDSINLTINVQCGQYNDTCMSCLPQML